MLILIMLIFRLKVTCSDKFSSVGNIITIDDSRNKRSSVAEKLSDSSLFKLRQKRQTKGAESSIMCNNLKIPLISLEPLSYSTNVLNSILNIQSVFILYYYFYFGTVHCSYYEWRARRYVQPLFPALLEGSSNSSNQHHCKWLKMFLFAILQ